MNSVSIHKTGLLLILLLAVQPLYSAAYASTPADSERPEREIRISYNFRNSLAYDQIVAWIPLDQAPIGSAALANLNVALHNAKQQAEINLCNGQWAPRGSVVFQQGPVIKQRSPGTNEILTWYYNVFRHPWKISCGTTSRAAFFLEMSRYLPDWIQIRPAGQSTAFRQGESLQLEQETVAIK